MTNELIAISPATRAVLLELSARTGRPVTVLLDVAVEELSQRLGAVTPVTEIPGVDPAEVWEAAAQAETGQLKSHDDVFAKLRNRP